MSSSAGAAQSPSAALTSGLDLTCPLAVIGSGLVTPAGSEPIESVFVHATGSFDVPGSPFVKAQPAFGAPAPDDVELGAEVDERVDLQCCPWLGHRLGQAARMEHMAQAAIEQALKVRTPTGVQQFRGNIGLYLVLASPRPGFDHAEQQDLERSLQRQLMPVECSVWWGDSAAFDALREAQKVLASGRLDGALIVAVDTHISFQAAAQRVKAPDSPWRPLVPPLGEGAGAVLVVDPNRAAQFGDMIAMINGVGLIEGSARLDNEELIDGLPMTGLLRRVREIGGHVAAWGPQSWSPLGSREWDLAFCRNRGVLLDESQVDCLEDDLGLLGAAATLVSLSHAINAYYYGAVEYDAVPEDGWAPIIVWGLGADSRRGVISVQLSRIRPDHAAREFTSSRGVPKLQVFPVRQGVALAPEMPAPQAPELASLVRFDNERGHPVPKEDHDKELVAGLLDEARMVARHRLLLPLRSARKEEQQFFRLQDAVASFGAVSCGHVQSWWRASLESDDPYRSFVLAYTWAAWSERDALHVLPQELALLPETARSDAHAAGRALALVPQPNLVHTLSEWSGHPHAVVSGAALSALAHLGMLQPEYISTVLSGEVKPLIADVLLWETAYLPHAVVSPWLHVVERWIHSTDARLSWHAARAATLHGSDTALRFLRAEVAGSDMPISTRLGAHAAELLAWAGDAQDAQLLAGWVERQDMTGAWLKNLALYGHAQVFSFLLRYLTDDDLAEDAASALELLFGPIVDALDRTQPAAWHQAVSRLDLQPTVRYRLGKPWSDRALAAELQRGELSWLDAQGRLAELQCRLARPLVSSQQWLAKDWLPHVHETASSLSALPDHRYGLWVTPR